MDDKQKRDAIGISDGACNPRAVARALVESLDKDCKEGWQHPLYPKGVASPATMLIFDQLKYLITGYQTEEASFAWDKWRKECEGESHG